MFMLRGDLHRPRLPARPVRPTEAQCEGVRLPAHHGLRQVRPAVQPGRHQLLLLALAAEPRSRHHQVQC